MADEYESERISPEKEKDLFRYDPDYKIWKWDGLVKYKNRENEFVSKKYDDSDWMANVVIYDNIELKLKELTSEETEKRKQESEKRRKALAKKAMEKGEQRGYSQKRINIMCSYSNKLATFADWYAQLLGESIGTLVAGR